MNCTTMPQLMEQCDLDLRTGKVKLIANGSYWVEVSQTLQRAIKAVSCVIEPQIGDTVLLFAEYDDRNYILSVLSRETESPAEMIFDKGVSIKSPEGEMRIEAKQAVVNINRTFVAGSTLCAKWDKVKTAAKSIETSADRWIQRLIRSYRFVDEFEESKIGRLRYLVKEMCSIKSKRTAITSEETVKIDGSKIMLG